MLQVGVFREGKMATGLNYDCRGFIEGQMDKELQGACGAWPYGNYSTLLSQALTSITCNF